jgi:hypothetical protein
LTQENALFIQPAAEDPEQYISFRKEIPYAIKGNARGAVTIKGLGLDRPALNERRGDCYQVLRHLYFLAQMNPALPESAEAQAYLRNASLDSAEFASMVRAAIGENFAIAP